MFLASCKPSETNPQQLFDSARLALVSGRLSESQLMAERGRKIFSPRNPQWTRQFQLLEAEIMILRGLSSDALTLLTPQPPSDIDQGDLGIKRRMLLGMAQIRLGNTKAAEQNLAEAESLCESSSCRSAGEVARYRGVADMEAHNLSHAAIAFRKSLQVARSQSDKFLEATALLNLGFVSLQLEHYDESIDWLVAAEKISRDSGFAFNEEKILGNLGWAYFKTGDFERALAAFEDARRRASEIGIVIDEIEWLNNEGLVYHQTGRAPEAEKLYSQSLQLAQKIKNSEQTIDALTAMALVSLEQGGLVPARTNAQQALDLATAQHDRVLELYPRLIMGKIAAAEGNREQAELNFFLVSSDAESDFSLRWEANQDLARLYDGRNDPKLANQKFLQALGIFECARTSLSRDESRIPFFANGRSLYDDYIHFLVDHGRLAEALQIADYSRARTLAEGLGTLPKGKCGIFHPTPVDLRRTAISVDGTLLFYWLSREQSYLWAVNSKALKLYKLPPASDIQRNLQVYRQAILESKDVLQILNPAGLELEKTLIAPAEDLLLKNSRVVIIPDGPQNNLNFETLLVASPQPHYLIEDYSILNAGSIRMLAAGVKQSASSDHKILLLGAAVPSADYPALPKAESEMKDVKKHFSASQVAAFSDGEATPEAYLLSGPEQFSYIHFVAHGTASLLQPLDSAVVLSKSSEQEDSFKLYARDIVRHPLRADLVTISACYGAGSRAYSGEGLVGLSWAFLRAGAHHVIGALWEVNDSSTPQLMDTMYAELTSGKAPDQALRTAKLKMLKSEGVFRKPFYWAPFQLYAGS